MDMLTLSSFYFLPKRKEIVGSFRSTVFVYFINNLLTFDIRRKSFEYIIVQIRVSCLCYKLKFLLPVINFSLNYSCFRLILIDVPWKDVNKKRYVKKNFSLQLTRIMVCYGVMGSSVKWHPPSNQFTQGGGDKLPVPAIVPENVFFRKTLHAPCSISSLFLFYWTSQTSGSFSSLPRSCFWGPFCFTSETRLRLKMTV